MSDHPDGGDASHPIQQLRDCVERLCKEEFRSASAAEMSRVLDLLHAAPSQVTHVDAKRAALDRQSEALATLVQCDAAGAILRAVEGPSPPQDEATRSHLLHVADKARLEAYIPSHK